MNQDESKSSELCVQEGLGVYERIHEGTTQQHLPLGDVQAQAEFAFEEASVEEETECVTDPLPDLTEKLKSLHHVPTCMKTEEELREEDPTQFG